MRFGELITSRSNARVKALRASFNGQASQPGDLVGIEGEILVAEALQCLPYVDTVFVRQGSEDILSQLPPRRDRVQNWVLLSRDVFDSALETRSPQGIAALLPIPEIMRLGLHPGPGVSLVAVGLQDPGNLGTLLRTAEAFAVKQVFLTPDSVNPWNPKSIRASAGSVFRMPVLRGDLAQIQKWLRSIGGPIYAAVSSGKQGVPITTVSLLESCALMIGNEGAGLSEEALGIADQSVWIPCATESLNAAVAGAVLMYEAMRQSVAHRLAQRGQSIESWDA
jgi:TrmH family RNA methyltransferase